MASFVLRCHEKLDNLFDHRQQNVSIIIVLIINKCLNDYFYYHEENDLRHET
jgi:hypothetical protein